MIGGKKTNQVKCYNANNKFFSSQYFLMIGDNEYFCTNVMTSSILLACSQVAVGKFKFLH